MAIREVRDFSKLPLEELMGSFMTHEIMMIKQDKEEEVDKKRKKIIALKSFTQEEDKEDRELEDNELEDIALLSKAYKRYLGFKKGNNSKKNVKDNYSIEKKRTISHILHVKSPVI